MIKLLDYLANPHGWEVLTAIAEMQPCSKTDVYNRVPGMSKTLKSRIDQLEWMGLISRKVTYKTQMITLTPKGAQIVEYLRDVASTDLGDFDGTHLLTTGRISKLLVIIAGRQPCCISNIYFEVGGNRSLLVDTCSILGRMGLISFDVGPYRSKVMSLTEKGSEVWAKLSVAVELTEDMAGGDSRKGTDGIGRVYGMETIPDIPQFGICRFADVNASGDDLKAVFVRLDDSDGYGLRPVYEAVCSSERGGFYICHDYNPNTGKWLTSDYCHSRDGVLETMERLWARPLRGFAVAGVVE